MVNYFIKQRTLFKFRLWSYKVGNNFVNLGAGTGNDCFHVHAEEGEKVKVIGRNTLETLSTKPGKCRYLIVQ